MNPVIPDPTQNIAAATRVTVKSLAGTEAMVPKIIPKIACIEPQRRLIDARSSGEPDA